MNRTLIASIIVILIVGGAIFFINKEVKAPTTDTPTGDQAVTPTPGPSDAPNPGPVSEGTVEITMTDAGFSPSSVNIKKGSTVKFVNKGTKLIWPASNPHPTHTDYPGFDPKVGIAVGDSWSFTFDKVGNWGFHDHLNPTRTGKINVSE